MLQLTMTPQLGVGEVHGPKNRSKTKRTIRTKESVPMTTGLNLIWKLTYGN
jgi:hypothetical protein